MSSRLLAWVKRIRQYLWRVSNQGPFDPKFKILPLSHCAPHTMLCIPGQGLNRENLAIPTHMSPHSISASVVIVWEMINCNVHELRLNANYGKCSKVLNTFLFLLTYKMLVFRVGMINLQTAQTLIRLLL